MLVIHLAVHISLAGYSLAVKHDDIGTCNFSYAPQHSYSTLDLSYQNIDTHDIWYVDGDVNVESGLTLLVFWERWCPHCKRELPKLNQIHERYANRGLKLIGLTRMTRKGTDQDAMQILQDYEVQYPTAKENGEISKLFRVRGIPTAAVLKDGVVIWRGNLTDLANTIWPSWLEK